MWYCGRPGCARQMRRPSRPPGQRCCAVGCLPRGSSGTTLLLGGSGLPEADSFAPLESWDECRVGDLRRGPVSKNTISKLHVFTPGFHTVHANVKPVKFLMYVSRVTNFVRASSVSARAKTRNGCRIASEPSNHDSSDK